MNINFKRMEKAGFHVSQEKDKDGNIVGIQIFPDAYDRSFHDRLLQEIQAKVSDKFSFALAETLCEDIMDIQILEASKKV